jgi:hypothetical protein
VSRCPSCKSDDVEPDEETAEEGDQVSCGDCGAQLTLTITKRIRLKHTEPEEDEDSDESNAV